MPKSLAKSRKRSKRSKSLIKTWKRKHEAGKTDCASVIPADVSIDIDKPTVSVCDSMSMPETPVAIGEPSTSGLQQFYKPATTSPVNSKSSDSDSEWEADLIKSKQENWNARTYRSQRDSKLFKEPGVLTETEVKSIEAQHEIEVEVVPRIEPPEAPIIQGNRIVELGYVLNWAIQLQYDHSKKCTFGMMTLKEEKRRGKGLVSTIVFQCSVCDEIIFFDTENPKRKRSPINIGAVWGTLASGSSYEHLTELLSCMDIPPMNRNMFYDLETELGKQWETSLWRCMEDAGAREKQTALDQNQICPDGVPSITVYLDGSWSKRSYGTNYNALSGMAGIIGKNTGELLYVGVRNRFCVICTRAETKKIEPVKHTCYKNWDGSAPAMEADIIVDGFNCSETMHGVRYMKFIGDGDSSVFAKIHQKVPYGKDVRKVECTNHALKNYGKRLRKTKADTSINLQGRKLLTEKKIKLLTKRAKCSIYEHAKKEVQDVDLLRKDLRLGLHHVFGDHTECSQEICNSPGENTNNLIPDLKSTLIYNHIRGDLDLLVRKAHLLIENENNNRTERLMNIVSRFTSGKRLNLVSRGSYQRRIHLSGLRHNKKFTWHSSPYKQVVGCSPGKYFKEFMDKKTELEEKKCKKRLFQDDKENTPKITPTKKIKRCPSNSDYGPNVEEPENEEVLKTEVEEVLARLQITTEERNQIQQKSVGQFGNFVFEAERRNRLTASLFGRVIKKKPQTPCHTIVRDCLKSTRFWSEATQYGISKEKVAISLFEIKTGLKVKDSGLWVDLQHGFLGASPDGIVDSEDALIEVKCIFSASKLELNSVEQVVYQLKSKICLEKHEGKIRLKRSHSYYFQVQGQLNITGKQKCYFVIYINDRIDLHIEEIERDEHFWLQNMLPKLTRFYKECIAPEIVRNNLGKELRCKDPPYIIKAIADFDAKKSRKHPN